MSGNPIPEAIRALEGTGLVEVTHGRGASMWTRVEARPVSCWSCEPCWRPMPRSGRVVHRADDDLTALQR